MHGEEEKGCFRVSGLILIHSSLVHLLIMGGCPSWWSMSELRPTTEEASPLLHCLPTSSSAFSQHPQLSTPIHPMNSWYENQEIPQTWSQLLLGGLATQDERCNLGAPFQAKKMENWENHLMYHSQGERAQALDVKQESSEDTGYAYSHGSTTEEIQATAGSVLMTSWNHILSASSKSSVTSSFNSNMLDFSNSNAERKHHPPPDNSSECNSTETVAALKRARVQGSSLSQPSNFKVRKEKLGDRITALHQLVSPFGKTDTASVLLEAIGYIRFLQSQIEALSSPYLARGSGNMRQPDGNDEAKIRDLRSRGLCLVPVSCTVHVESDNGADYWAPSLNGGF